MPRDTDGYRIEPTWDAWACAPRVSDDTILEGAFVPDRYIPRVVPAGLAGADLFVLGIFAWAEPTFANIYLGIAQRAIDLAVASLKKQEVDRSGWARDGLPPDVQHSVAEMALILDGMIGHVEQVADDWSNGVDHGGLWPAKLVSAKYHCVEGAKRIVDLAMEVSGGAGMFKSNELERLYRDVRCGGFHAANARWCTKSSARRRSAFSARSRAGRELIRSARLSEVQSDGKR